MLNKFPALILLILAELVAQPTPNHLHRMEQKDSLYYLLTDNSLLKFYSHLASGEFFLTKYVEGNFPSSTKFMLNDDHLFLSYNDSIFYYLNGNPWELNFDNAFKPGFTITSLHGFGPYFFVRSGNTYHLFKIVNGLVELVEDSLFNQPLYHVYFTYPFVVIDSDIYKYIENFDFYLVGQAQNLANQGINGNTLIAYQYYIEYPSYVEHSTLFKTIIEEPSFPNFTYDWGYNISQLHQNHGQGLFIPRKNLYYMTWVGVITTYNSQLAYLPTTEDRATITDYYIFLLGSDSLRYSKWNAGSTFYDFTWTDYTSVENNNKPLQSFELFQNYPNPFNPNTSINYQVPIGSYVLLTVYDVLGREVVTLVNEEKPAGKYKVDFDGSEFSSGIYFYRMKSGDFISTRKMILLK